MWLIIQYSVFNNTTHTPKSDVLFITKINKFSKFTNVFLFCLVILLTFVSNKSIIKTYYYGNIY